MGFGHGQWQESWIELGVQMYLEGCGGNMKGKTTESMRNDKDGS